MNMKPIYVIVCLCIFVCSSCAESINVIDSTGRFVSVETPVNKVVSLGTGVAEYLYTLDEGVKLVGRDSYSYFPPAI